MNTITRDLTDFNYQRNLNRLVSEEHLDLHVAILDMINEYGAEALHLVPHIDEYTVNIETERTEMQNNVSGKIARYMTARYSTDRQCKRIIHVACMFYACMPSKELNTFIIELNLLIKNRFGRLSLRNKPI